MESQAEALVERLVGTLEESDVDGGHVFRKACHSIDRLVVTGSIFDFWVFQVFKKGAGCFGCSMFFRSWLLKSWMF